MDAQRGALEPRGIWPGSWLDLVMSPQGTPLEGSRKLDNLKGTFLGLRTLHVETRANKGMIIITGTLFVPSWMGDA